jgi:hypothetical protein
MTRFKIGVWIALAVGLAALVGWLYGWSGMRPLQRQLEHTRLRQQLCEARMKVLDARVDVFTANFGNASRNLEYAKPPLQAARTWLQGRGQQKLAATLVTAVEMATQAQQLASKFSQDANSRAGEASRLIDEVLREATALP